MIKSRIDMKSTPNPLINYHIAKICNFLQKMAMPMEEKVSANIALICNRCN